MSKAVPSSETLALDHFDEHAVDIARRQYFQPSDRDLAGMFRRVATWVAGPEQGEGKAYYAKAFFELMASKRFCPGGRVLAGAATSHGNVLNCFVQDGGPEVEGGNAWVLNLATKLALVTKVGGGNGLCLDFISPKREYQGPAGRLFLTVSPSHPDYQKVKDGTYLDLVHGEYVTRGYRFLSFIEQDSVPGTLKTVDVGDSVEAIWRSAGDAIYSILAGEDILLDVSALRAEGTPVQGSGGTSSGPSSFAVEVFDNFSFWASLGGADYAGPVATLRYIFAPTLRVIRQGGTRRGAGMATISITHPDVHDFITAKDLDREQDEGDISTFNISVLASDAFMNESLAEGNRGVLWDIADHAWQTGEPGLIFIDRINAHNPMRGVLGDIRSTNPCGEIPLYPGEPCDLGAMNLAAYVLERRRGLDGFDSDSFRRDVRMCIRFLDNVLDVNAFALEDNREMSMSLRRLGLGVMGLADALIKMGYAYNSEAGREVVEEVIGALRDAATEASEELAAERGTFPRSGDSTLSDPRRNIAILTVAPTGTTSMLMGVSSGVEPVFAPFIYRKIGDSYSALIHPLFRQLLEEHPPHRDYLRGEGEWDWDRVMQAVQENHGSVQGLDFIPDDVKAVLICAHDISPEDHVLMQGVVQSTFDDGKMVANSISKTINMPNRTSVEDVFKAYGLAFEVGCKGITVYRDGSRQFQVLSTKAEADLDPDLGNRHLDLPASEDRESLGSAEVSLLVPEDPELRLPGEPLFDRPGRLTGFTDQVKLTDLRGQKRGFYVTVNQQDDLPTEVFISSGKAGDEANADSEALGRVVSIALQYGVPAEALVKTLRGINGGMYGTYQGRMVASKADLIAVALETSGVENPLRRGVGCPDCGSPLRFEEGCQVCGSCGYSKCG
ncbi:MAG: adenosylcobalamin-dependent ribonucleoside-diphosphate reductase [Truepera sp.]|nr:adenosylcobalamin-dependent ribonucleoside-diphosphate reductase [Truepera sp.]